MGVGVRVVVVFSVRELEGALAGVMECIKRSVVGGTSADMVGRGWGGLVCHWEGFE